MAGPVKPNLQVQLETDLLARGEVESFGQLTQIVSEISPVVQEYFPTVQGEQAEPVVLL
jgi:hypothetical protein